MEPSKHRPVAFAIAAFAVAGLIVVIAILGCGAPDQQSGNVPPSRKAAPAAKPSPGIGDMVRIDCGEKNGTLVASSREALTQLTDACRAGDSRGVAELMVAKNVAVVPRGAKALLIGQDMFARRVRIQNGKLAGEAVWVSSEFVKR